MRYALLGIALLIFAYSETMYHYSHTTIVPFVMLMANAFLCKAIVVAVLLAILIPLLLKQRYAIFCTSVFVVIIIAVWLQHIAIEGIIYKHFGLYFWKERIDFWYIIIDLSSQNAIWFLFTLGLLMGRMLKYWSKEFEHKQQILASQLQMETESMKEQVSPAFLCKTLHKSGKSALTAPEETSDILMQLSRLLRYQLYDCRHEKVLLDSEIQFLNKYLSILKYNGECSDFNISVSGQTMGILIPPLLFVPFLQSSPTSADRLSFIDIKIMVYDNQLSFDLTNNIATKGDVSTNNLAHQAMQTQNIGETRNEAGIRQRLEQLYPQKYSLTIEPEHILLKIQFQ